MTNIGTRTRRRVRSIHPDVLRVIREDLATGASAPQVADALSRRQQLGQLEHPIPSPRTISNIAREMRRDDSAPWTIEDADPATVQDTLRILNAVVRHSEGYVDHFTQREAALLPILLRATEPRYSAWQLFIWARFYISWVRTAQDAQDVVLALAALPENSMDLTEAGRVVQRKGSWVMRLMPRFDRVFNAIAGWLPPELQEVSKP